MAAQMIGGGRPMRTCMGCGQTDDHPRCVMELGDGSNVTWHQDCHRLAFGELGCHPLVADGKTGSDLLDHILANSGG